MNQWIKVAAGAVIVVGVAAAAGFFVLRGRTGATTAIGGELEAVAIPEFTSLEPARWVNGEPSPLARARGEVVLIEAWAPS